MSLSGANPACTKGSGTTSGVHNLGLASDSLVISPTINSAQLIERISGGADGLNINTSLSQYRGAVGSAGLYNVNAGTVRAGGTPYCIPRSGIMMGTGRVSDSGPGSSPRGTWQGFPGTDAGTVLTSDTPMAASAMLDDDLTLLRRIR